MYKKIISLTLLIGSLFANETTPAKADTAMGYFEIGLGPFPVPLPVFGVGYRFQRGHHGVDVPFQVSTIVAVTQVKSSLIYQYYFKPNLKSEFYMGAGAEVSGLFYNRHQKTTFLFSPEFLVGKQYINDAGDTRFMQAQISWPTFGIHTSKRHNGVSRPFWGPLVVFSYGMGF